MSNRAYVLGVGVAAVASMLLRLRFVFTPLSTDEGGFVAIARSWAHGATLYRDVWVDRPQGLLALFRLWDMVSLGNEQSVRVMAMLLGAIMVVAGAEIGRRLHSRRAGVLAAAFVAAASSAALIEGFHRERRTTQRHVLCPRCRRRRDGHRWSTVDPLVRGRRSVWGARRFDQAVRCRRVRRSLRLAVARCRVLVRW